MTPLSRLGKANRRRALRGMILGGRSQRVAGLPQRSGAPDRVKISVDGVEIEPHLGGRRLQVVALHETHTDLPELREHYSCLDSWHDRRMTEMAQATKQLQHGFALGVFPG